MASKSDIYRGIWRGAAVSDPATAFKFEFYDLWNDWTQYTDVASKNPVRVQEMRDLMFGEFAKYQVLPLDGSASTRFVTPREDGAAGCRAGTKFWIRLLVST